MNSFIRRSNAKFALVAQLLRYAVSGGAAAVLYSVTYWVAISSLNITPMIANFAAWIASFILSYVLHSRWSFRDLPLEPGSGHAAVRFLIVNIAGLGLNSIWVWLIVTVLRLDPRAALVPILSVTPCLMFFACRWWAFR
jgi:Predicted membrane protein